MLPIISYSSNQISVSYAKASVNIKLLSWLINKRPVHSIIGMMSIFQASVVISDNRISRKILV